MLTLLLASLAAAPPDAAAESLAARPPAELERLYRAASAGSVPLGDYDGFAVYPDGRPLAGVRGGLSRAVWKGKRFRCGSMVNRWAGFEAVEASVYVGRSWLDGRPSVMLDYRGRSLVWGRVRDEIREVAPGVYVGVMVVDAPGGPKVRAYFTLGACGPR